MRCAGYTARAAAAVGTLAAVSCSIVTDAFIAAPSLHAAAHHHRHNHDDKLRFASNNRQPTALASTPPLQAAGRWRCIHGRRIMSTTGESPLGLLSPSVAAGLRVSGTARGSSQRRPRATTTVGCRMSTDGGGEDVLNPLARGDAERARVNNLITILAETPMNQWKPAILDEYMSSLLKRGIYRQTMAERLAKVRSGEDQEALVRVDAYLTGFLGQESRRASRKKVSIILSAATAGPEELDDCVQTLQKEDLLDSDLTEYVASLVTAEANRGTQSSLLKVLKMVRDRIQAELKTESRPEVRTLARALQIEDAAERKKFLQHTFTKLEELDEFVKFVEEGIEYLGNDFGFALRTNMPQDHFDKMKAVYAEAAAIRRLYLQ